MTTPAADAEGRLRAVSGRRAIAANGRRRLTWKSSRQHHQQRPEGGTILSIQATRSLAPEWLTPFTAKALPRKGAANLGVVGHTRPGEHGEILRVIEKRISLGRRSEIAICNQLAAAWRSGYPAAMAPLPDVYSVQRTRQHASISMKHCQGCGRKTKNPVVCGQLIARSLTDLAAIQLQLRSCNATILEVLEALGFSCLGWKHGTNRDYQKLHGRTVRQTIDDQ